MGFTSSCGQVQSYCESNMAACGGCEPYQEWLQTKRCCSEDIVPCYECTMKFYNN